VDFSQRPAAVQRRFLQVQKAQKTAHSMYQYLARQSRDPEHSRILAELGDWEMQSYQLAVRHSGRESSASRFVLGLLAFLRTLFGLTFVIKFMEIGERRAEQAYGDDPLGEHYPEDMARMVKTSEAQEQALIGMIKEERLNYLGSIVLGLNDALVELTGALAGLTFVFQDSRLIGFTGLITGIAASFSMGASEYLSRKTEGGGDAMRSAAYTFLSYIAAVAVLITPFLALSNPYASLVIALALAWGIIGIFSYYLSVVKEDSFKRRFLEMAAVSTGVAGLSFGFGALIKVLFDIKV